MQRAHQTEIDSPLKDLITAMKNNRRDICRALIGKHYSLISKQLIARQQPNGAPYAIDPPLFASFLKEAVGIYTAEVRKNFGKYYKHFLDIVSASPFADEDRTNLIHLRAAFIIARSIILGDLEGLKKILATAPMGFVHNLKLFTDDDPNENGRIAVELAIAKKASPEIINALFAAYTRSDLNNLLLQTLHNGNTELLQALLNYCAAENINIENAETLLDLEQASQPIILTALALAVKAEKQSQEIINALLDKHARSEPDNMISQTLRNGSAELLQVLLDYYAKENITIEDGKKLLDLAAEQQASQPIGLVVSQRYTTEQLKNELSNSVINNNTAVAQIILNDERITQPMVTDAFVLAVNNNQLQIAQDICLHLTDDQPQNILISAIEHNDIKIIKAILADQRANLHAALASAIEENNVDFVRKILEMGLISDITVPITRRGANALGLALNLLKNSQMAEIICANYTDTQLQHLFNVTLKHHKSINSIRDLDTILGTSHGQACITPNILDRALCFASEKGLKEAIPLLLTHALDRLSMDNNVFERALCLAARSNHSEVITLIVDAMVQHGRWRHDNNGIFSAHEMIDHALGIAAESGHVSATQLLLNNSTPDGRNEALKLAAGSGQLATVQMFTKDIEWDDLDRYEDIIEEARKLADQNGHPEVVDYLTKILNYGLSQSSFKL